MKVKLLKRLFILALFIGSSVALSAQIQWEKSYGGSLYENANSIIQTSDGGYAVFGMDSSCDGDITKACKGSYDLWVVKLNATGAIQWQKSFGGQNDEEAYQIVQTKDHGYAMAAITFSPNVAGFKGGSDAWVLRLDSAGTLKWAYTYGGSGLDEATSIALTKDGGFIVGGNSTSNDGDVTGHHGTFFPDTTAKDDMWIMKLDSMGKLQWQKSLGGTLDDGSNSILQANDLGYVVVGNSSSNDGDLAGKGNHGYNDWMVVKLTPAGNVSWVKLYGGSTQDDAANSVQKTPDGGYIIAGATGSKDGDVTGNHGAPCTAAECQDNDCWIVKIDSVGTLKWEKAFGGTGNENCFSIVTTTDGGYLFGAYSTSTDGDVTGNHGLYDYWVVKLDATGKMLWGKSYGGAGNDQPFSIIQTKDGGIALAGVSESVNGDVTGNHGNTDFWVIKLSPATSIAEYETTSGNILVYPNPFSSQTTVHILNPAKSHSGSEFTLYDATGRLVQKISNIQDQDFNLSRGDLNPGIYFYQLSNSGKLTGKGKLSIQ